MMSIGYVLIQFGGGWGTQVAVILGERDEGFRAFKGDRCVGRTPEFRAGYEAGYLQGVHEEA